MLLEVGDEQEEVNVLTWAIFYPLKQLNFWMTASLEYEFITIRRSTEKIFGFYAEAISGQWRKYSDFALKLSVVYQTTIVSFIPFRSKEKIFGFFMSKACLAEAISGQPMLGHQSHLRTKLSLLQSSISSC